MAEVLSLDLADLVAAKQVSVVQELDLGKLAAALTALQDAVNAKPAAPEGPSKEEFAALAGELAAMKQDMADKHKEIEALKGQQAELSEQLSQKLGKHEIDPQAIADLKAGLQALGDKVEETAAATAGADAPGGDAAAGLEARVEDLAGGLAALKGAVQALQAVGPDGDSAAPPAAAAAVAGFPASAGGASPAEFAALAAKQEAADAALAELRDAQDALRRAQEELRKGSREASLGAEDAKAAANSAAGRLGEQAGQIEALRAAIEALNNGDKVELPAAPTSAPVSVDLGPLERRVAQKADADTVEAMEARLDGLEAGLRAARSAADAAGQQGAAASAQAASLASQMATAPPAASTLHTTTTTASNAEYASASELAELRAELVALVARLDAAESAAGGASDLASSVAGLQAELAAVLSALDGKASKADVDALLAAGAPLPAGGASGDGQAAAAAEGGLDPDSATAASVAVTVNELRAQLAQMQGFLKVLQGRMDDKAGRAEVESLARAGEGMRETIRELKETVREIQRSLQDNSKSSELQKQVSTIERRISSLEGMLPSQYAGSAAPAAATAPPAGSEGGAAGGQSTAHLEAGLRDCQAGLQAALARLADLAAALEGLAGLRAEVDASSGAKGAMDASVAALRDELAAVRAALAGKADKSEVDALLEGGAAAALGEAGGGGAGATDGQLPGDADVRDAIPVLNDLTARVAQLGTTLKVLQERVAGKADASSLDAKADGEAVARLEAALGSKADLSALTSLKNELERLRRELNGKLATAAAAAGAGSGLGAGGGGAMPAGGAASGGVAGGDWLAALAGKADKAEVDALRAALDALARAVPAPPAGSGASTAGSPRDRMGSGRRQSPGASAAAAAAAGDGDRTAALRRDMESLAAAVEAIAHAANVMGVGPNEAAMPLAGPTHYPLNAATAASAVGGGAAGGGGGRSGANGPPGAGSGGTGLLASAKDGIVIGPTNIPHGAADRLRDLLSLGAFNHKMDWFNPAWLEDLARRIGELESAVRSLKARPPAGKQTAEMPGRSQGGGKDYDKMIMKLGKDIAGLKKSLADLGAAGGGGGWGGTARVPDGDHAMLSSKPLFGYRCMACDRPLEKLDEKPGPYIPNNQMPSSVAPYERRGIGVPAGLDSPPKPMHDAKRSHEHSANRNAHAGSDGRGPQNWYQNSHGPSAANLPRNDVGPHLPPGGWRGADQGTGTTSSNGALQARRPSRGSIPDGERLPPVGAEGSNGLKPTNGGGSAESSPTSLPSI